MISYFLLTVCLTLVFATFATSRQKKSTIIMLVAFPIITFSVNYFVMPLIDARTYAVWLELFVTMLLGCLINKKFVCAGFLTLFFSLIIGLFYLSDNLVKKYQFADDLQIDEELSQLDFMSDIYQQKFDKDLTIKNEQGETFMIEAGLYKIGYFKNKDKIAIYSFTAATAYFATEINGKKVDINYKPEANFNYNLKRRILNALPFYTDTEFVYRGIRISAKGELYQVMERLVLIRGFYTSNGYVLVNAENGCVETHGILPEWLR